LGLLLRGFLLLLCKLGFLLLSQQSFLLGCSLGLLQPKSFLLTQLLLLAQLL
jgi:hypothetical protein